MLKLYYHHYNLGLLEDSVIFVIRIKVELTVKSLGILKMSEVEELLISVGLLFCFTVGIFMGRSWGMKGGKF